jgi:hypothetical protein
MERDYVSVKVLTAVLLSSSLLIAKPHKTRSSAIIRGSGAVRHMLSSQQPEIVFKPGQAGSGKTQDGSPFSFTDWEGSGVGLSLWTEERGSPARARMALRAISRGKELLEQGTKVNNRGQKIGERVVLKFHFKETNGEQIMIAWTNGSKFQYLQSSALKTILAFEEQMINGQRDIPKVKR